MFLRYKSHTTMIKKLFAILSVLCIFLGCSKTHVQIPAYIEIDNYFTKVAHLNADSTQGTNNQNFTDVLVYANGTSYGTYPMGSKIPVLASGPTSFIIRGVIRVNGVDALRSDYELMKGCDTVITVNPGNVTRVIPVFEYFSAATFKWMYDAEPNTAQFGGVSPVVSGHPETTTTYTPGFGGYGTCLALRSNDTINGAVQTKNSINLLQGGVGTYLELNYLSNTTIQILINDQDGGSIKPSGTWNKIYITLTEQVSSFPGPYTIKFISYYDPTIGPNLALLDNIKLIQAQ